MLYLYLIPLPPRKRLKLDLGSVAAGPPLLKKRKLFEFRTARLRKVTSAYRDNIGELFFLTNGTNVTDNLMSFRRKPTQQFVNFLKVSDAPARVISEVQTAVLGQQGAPPAPSTRTCGNSCNILGNPPMRAHMCVGGRRTLRMPNWRVLQYRDASRPNGSLCRPYIQKILSFSPTNEIF